MRKSSFLLISLVFLSVSDISMSEVNEYLQCSFKENTIEKNFYWSIGSDNKIHRWVSGEPNSVINSLVMNDEKNIAWNEIGNPMGIFVLDKKKCDKAAPYFRVRTKFLIDGSVNAVILKKISF